MSLIFFGSVQNVELTGQKYNLSDTDDITTNNNNIINNITYSNIDINNVSSSITSSTSYKLKNSNNLHLFNVVNSDKSSPSSTTVFNSKFFVLDIG